jgi:HD-GYP domain-containing protein (c-di-GMP phosphodiesterase class II)
VYDALTTARSYRPALPAHEALRIMDRESGQVVDPEIYAMFRTLIVDQPMQRSGILRLHTPGAFAAA